VDAQPRLAKLGEKMLGEPGVVLVATVRKDGSPRLSAVEPFFWEGELWLTMMLGSFKAKDLLRDPRILVHSIVTSRSGAAGEFKLRGQAVPERDGELQGRLAAKIGDELDWRPVPGKFHLFRVEVDDVTFIRYDEPTGDQYVTRWPHGAEFVRRGTSATSLGPPEPMSELLV
jgi:pyridoxamine 5'-phosphate oxidase-like protein